MRFFEEDNCDKFIDRQQHFMFAYSKEIKENPIKTVTRGGLNHMDIKSKVVNGHISSVI